MNPEKFEQEHLSLEEQFKNPEMIELGGKTVEVIDIHPEISKTEVPVVVAPGWAATPEVFKDNILTLAELGRRTISVNSPHGIETSEIEGLPEAELRKVAALMEALKEKDIDQIDAIGHSEAGIYLTIAATLYPDKFRNLVLVDPGGMIGKDKPEYLAARFSLDILRQTIRSLREHEIIKPAMKASLVAGRAVGGAPAQSLREVVAISNTQIHDLLRGLREKGIGISIIHAVDDKAFPMERVQKIAKKDQLNGFYSVKGTHNEFYLHPEKYTRLAEHALAALESRKTK
ncbi:MAG: alpha/beta fold hydrolase [Patescibacteria group bacterium]